MKPITPTTFITGLLLLFFVATFIKAMILKKQKDLFFFKLTEANGFCNKIREELKDLHDKHNKTKQFKATLSVAELTTQLQKSRLSAQASAATNSIPEKYSFVHSLIKKKMDSNEIASILAISSHEAEQLVTLSKLGQAR